jgi:predicted Zn-dependent protease
VTAAGAGAGLRPQDAVEQALAAARSDDCVVIAEETSSANLRWARNTLTTNGVSASRRLTVIAISRGAGGTRAGGRAEPARRGCPGAARPGWSRVPVH